MMLFDFNPAFERLASVMDIEPDREEFQVEPAAGSGAYYAAWLLARGIPWAEDGIGNWSLTLDE